MELEKVKRNPLYREKNVRKKEILAIAIHNIKQKRKDVGTGEEEVKEKVNVMSYQEVEKSDDYSIDKNPTQMVKYSIENLQDKILPQRPFIIFLLYTRILY